MHTLVTDLYPNYYPPTSPYGATRLDADRRPMFAVFDIDETINGIDYRGSAHVEMSTAPAGAVRGYIQNFFPALGTRDLTPNATRKLTDVLVAELRDRYAAITRHDYLALCRAELVRKWDYRVTQAIADRDQALTIFDTRFPDVATRDTPNGDASRTAYHPDPAGPPLATRFLRGGGTPFKKPN